MRGAAPAGRGYPEMDMGKALGEAEVGTMNAPANLQLQSPADAGYRMPAEWEPHARCWMAWPHKQSLWPNDLEGVQQAYAAVAQAIRRFEPVTVIAHPDAAAELLPIMAVAVRSVRDPERESGLHTVLTVFARRPELRAQIAAALPELELPEEPPCW